MAMVKLQGWCLPSPETETLAGQPVNFFLNPRSLVSSQPVTLGGMAGYLVLDQTAVAYFLAYTEAEMSTLAQLVT